MRELIFPMDGPVLMMDDEVDAMLEIAYLAVHADGEVAPEEREAFVAQMVQLYAGTLTPDRARDLVEKLEVSPGTIDAARLAQLAGALHGNASKREAYKVAVAITLADRKRNQPEAQFEAALRAALELPTAEAEAITRTVIEALTRNG